MVIMNPNVLLLKDSMITRTQEWKGGRPILNKKITTRNKPKFKSIEIKPNRKNRVCTIKYFTIDKESNIKANNHDKTSIVKKIRT